MENSREVITWKRRDGESPFFPRISVEGNFFSEGVDESSVNKT